MFSLRDNHRERKLAICDRIRSRTQTSRRPIVDVLEVKLENYVQATNAALKQHDEDVFRSLISFSRFQAGGRA